VTAPPPDSLGRAPGVVRLLNSAGGRVLCLAGAVDETVVAAFLRRYGREPATVDVIDARSVTFLSASGARLVHEHVTAARRSGRPVALHPSPAVTGLLRPSDAG
jgi:anti-anti-sigma regulatory factor